MAYEKELKTGADIAREAGILALKIREGALGIEIKADESPVTVADKACWARKAPCANRRTAGAGLSIPSTARAILYAARGRGRC
jgi:hypothetical protein